VVRNKAEQHLIQTLALKDEIYDLVKKLNDGTTIGAVVEIVDVKEIPSFCIRFKALCSSIMQYELVIIIM